MSESESVVTCKCEGGPGLQGGFQSRPDVNTSMSGDKPSSTGYATPIQSPATRPDIEVLRAYACKYSKEILLVFCLSGLYTTMLCMNGG